MTEAAVGATAFETLRGRDLFVVPTSRARARFTAMSYNLTLQCGCVVYVSCHPATRLAHTRIIQARAAGCRVRKHEVGVRLFLWEILPDPAHAPQAPWADAAEDIRWTV